MANISFTQGEWKKENLKFHIALKRKYISYILKQIVGHFLRHSNSEIKWVSKRNNGLLFSGENVQWILSCFEMCKGQTGTCPYCALSVGGWDCLHELTGLGCFEDCFVQYILLGKANLWYSSIHGFVRKASQGAELNLHYEWFEQLLLFKKLYYQN